MTDPLRDLFDQLVSDEPPLRTSADETATRGRRQVRRNRSLWTVAGTVLVVGAIAVVPQVLRPGAGPDLVAGGPTGDPSATASLAPTPTDVPGPQPSRTAEPSLVAQSHRICPHAAPPVRGTDASLLPDLAAAQQAVLDAAPRVAPGFTFTASPASAAFVGQAKFNGAPFENIIFNVGDGAGYGFLSFQITVENDAPASVRAARDTNPSTCTDVTWYDFPDGSVAVFTPDLAGGSAGTPSQVFYYGAGGIQMNIGQGATGYADPAPTEPWPASTLPARGANPLTMEQVLLLADTVARAG